MISKDKFVAARKASGLSLESAAEKAEMSKQGYVNREKRPEQFRLCELAKVYEALSDTAKPILKDAVSDIFLP
ncbi:hypothetical protein [Gordonibacter massiliensis (ex Traore et al. 2017)]|uniref:hypothetical protein n=1 Tax=Gordonibacter massiliensis (ex Traore et al. 2017) TaxID=1841863 RepID=UPI001C8B4313|nr:hypothetical protein [Gordonibacter massiliensis (ex Traore et al. 2017)]MBX9032639.1 hypothetical protein [Gordonibacter massiliensis (ex Traore et al. 2017)]